MYMESSSPNYPDKIAHLTTPTIDLSGVTQPGLSFWYHMYGATTGELHVDVWSGGAWVLDVMPALIGQQQAAQGYGDRARQGSFQHGTTPFVCV